MYINIVKLRKTNKYVTNAENHINSRGRTIIYSLTQSHFHIFLIFYIRVFSNSSEINAKETGSASRRFIINIPAPVSSVSI